MPGVSRRDALELIGGLIVLGAMFPENPVVGGTVLQRAAIQSPNFVTGSTGWTIKQDGSAEFNNLVVRGGQIISGTALYYSTSPPAAGKLVASVSAASGTDSVGNAYIGPGVFNYVDTGGGQFNAVGIQNGTLTFYTAATEAGPWTAQANIDIGTTVGDMLIQSGGVGSVLVSASGAGKQIVLTATSPASGTLVQGGITADTGTITSGLTNPIFQVINTSGASSPLLKITMPNVAGPLLALGAIITGDTNSRISLDLDASLNARVRLGSGSAAPDVVLTRTGANKLSLFTSDFDITTVGRGLQVAEGTNARMGTATLNGTTGVVIANTTITASTRIFLTTNAASGTLGCPVVASRVAGTSFTIKSTVAGDTSTVAWFLVEPG